jgi:GH24 family phage-related lysozyme (muramidase)
VAGSLDGRARRVRRLEERNREPIRPAPSRTQEEIRAIDAEIARLEREMRAEGIDPYREPDGTWTNSAGHPTHTLDEHIAMLEVELEEEIERCPGD